MKKITVREIVENAGVEFICNTTVTDTDFADGENITVTGSHTECNGLSKKLTVISNCRCGIIADGSEEFI